MIVRRETAADRSAVTAVHDAAFAPAAAPGGRPVPSAESVLVEALRTDGDAWLPPLSLVADDGEVIGHVLCTRARVGGFAALGLGPLAVRPDRQRRGIGSVLVHAVCAAADALGEPLVVLLGDPAFYGRLGFVPAAHLQIRPPVPGWAEHFLARPLDAFDPALHRGAFRYAEPFEAVG